ncbi:MAG: DUF1801 domain-containing protein [Patescibacteria group bacterium]
MAELKTKLTDQDPKEFLETIEPESKKKDGFELLKLFEKITGEKGKMWGTSIVGYGMYHYKSERSTQEGDWPLVGFSPRKQNLTLYLMSGFEGHKDVLSKLGKHKTSSGSCLYISKLTDVDMDVLKKLIESAYLEAKRKLT